MHNKNEVSQYCMHEIFAIEYKGGRSNNVANGTEIKSTTGSTRSNPTEYLNAALLSKEKPKSKTPH